jgi:hypothetical protein
MERVKPFTPRDVRCNKYTVIDGKLVITYTKTIDDYVEEVKKRMYDYIVGGRTCLKSNVNEKKLFLEN